MAPKHDSKTESGSRWSIEEVKNLFMRPFSGSGQRGSGGAPGTGADRDSGMSFGGLRWSLEDIKDKFFGGTNKEGGDVKASPKGKRKQLTPEERQQRRAERLEARKNKKSKREKERRGNVNGLFDQLGTMLKVDEAKTKESKKGARLSILSAAVNKLKNGKDGEVPAHNTAIMEENSDDDEDKDDDDDEFEEYDQKK
jgi:hypothetical protein